MWRIDLFGGVRATHGSRVISHFESRKAVSLLAYLAYHSDRTHPREVLAELLGARFSEPRNVDLQRLLVLGRRGVQRLGLLVSER